MTCSRTSLAHRRIAHAAPTSYRVTVNTVVSAPRASARRAPASSPRRLAIQVATAAALVAALSSTPAGAEPATAIRAGWAYGLGVEVEYRPGQWGVGASGGYVPGYGPGGYLGAQWGLHPLDRSGPVAEAGIFRGVHNPLRAADSGLGAYLQAGYTVASGRLSARAVAGGGVPVGDDAHPLSFELLAKLTFGVAF